MKAFSAIKRTTFYTLLASVYVAFFAVQCIYNFDVSNTVTKAYSVQIKKADDKQQQYLSVASQQHPAKKNIRLNKRFQPETLPVIIPTINAPLIVFSEKAVADYREAVYTSSIYQTFLRGPPAVICYFS